jgi:uncharacterized damage-inducible protein DinB
MASTRAEAWLRGPLDGVPPLLMPVAHALVQAREDLQEAASAAIKQEGVPGTRPARAAELLEAVRRAVDDALRVLRQTPETELLVARAVGRARLPTNVLGLLVHAAEHTQRHTGQVITTSKILRGSAGTFISS